jgi:hypothetical protein
MVALFPGAHEMERPAFEVPSASDLRTSPPTNLSHLNIAAHSAMSHTLSSPTSAKLSLGATRSVVPDTEDTIRFSVKYARPSNVNSDLPHRSMWLVWSPIFDFLSSTQEAWHQSAKRLAGSEESIVREDWKKWVDNEYPKILASVPQLDGGLHGPVSWELHTHEDQLEGSPGTTITRMHRVFTPLLLTEYEVLEPDKLRFRTRLFAPINETNDMHSALRGLYGVDLKPSTWPGKVSLETLDTASDPADLHRALHGFLGSLAGEQAARDSIRTSLRTCLQASDREARDRTVLQLAIRCVFEALREVKSSAPFSGKVSLESYKDGDPRAAACVRWMGCVSD